jgi:hypothetical protein
MTELSNINNTFESYQQLISFYEEHRDKQFQVIPLSFSSWFAANMCSALAGLLDKLSENFNEVKIHHIPPLVETILQKNQFLSYFGQPRIDDNYHTTIRFLKLKPTDGKYFNSYIFHELLGRAELPQMSEMVKGKMAEAIYEIFVNAQIHSETPNIYTCGQFFPAITRSSLPSPTLELVLRIRLIGGLTQTYLQPKPFFGRLRTEIPPRKVFQVVLGWPYSRSLSKKTGAKCRSSAMMVFIKLTVWVNKQDFLMVYSPAQL